MKTQVLVITCLLGLLSACGDKQDPIQEQDGNVSGDQDGQPDGETNGEGDSPVTYTSHIKSILDTSCSGCHSSQKQGADRNGAPVGVDFDSYDAAKASAQRGNARIQAGSMPPSGGLSSGDRALFQSWVDQGLPE